MEKQIKMTPLAEIGEASATITKNSVDIRTRGISGSLKAWLIGREAMPIGNIVDGKLQRNIDTQNHSGILITQSGRQMFLGYFDEKPFETERTPFEPMGFNWQRISEKSFAKADGHIRFILSNRRVYENYKKHQHYFIGENERGGAIALKYDEADECPFGFLEGKRLYKNGYAIVCIDKISGKLYIPD